MAATPAGESAPHVVSQFVASEPAAPRWPAFVIRFNHSMDAASVAAALSLKPAVAFDLTRNFQHDEARLTVREPLAPQTHPHPHAEVRRRRVRRKPLARSTAWMYALV